MLNWLKRLFTSELAKRLDELERISTLELSKRVAELERTAPNVPSGIAHVAADLQAHEARDDIKYQSYRERLDALEAFVKMPQPGE